MILGLIIIFICMHCWIQSNALDRISFPERCGHDHCSIPHWFILAAHCAHSQTSFYTQTALYVVSIETKSRARAHTPLNTSAIIMLILLWMLAVWYQSWNLQHFIEIVCFRSASAHTPTATCSPGLRWMSMPSVISLCSMIASLVQQQCIIICLLRWQNYSPCAAWFQALHNSMPVEATC